MHDFQEGKKNENDKNDIQIRRVLDGFQDC